MNIKFDLVRIGEIRKNYNAEMIIKQNINLLKTNIHHLMKEE